MWHSCARYRVADHFKGKPAAIRALFRQFATLVRSLGPVHTYAQKSRIVFQARARFAGAVVRRTHLEGALWLKRPVALPRFHRTEFIPPDNHIHYFRLRAPEELDPVLTDLLREAYGVGCQLHLLEKRASADGAAARSRGRERGPGPSLRRTGRRAVADAGQTGGRQASPVSDASLGVRLGFFPGLEGADSVLLHGTSAQIYMLIPRLYEFLASPLTEWPVHEFALVSRRRPARLFASRWGMSGSTGFRWRCSPAELPSIQAALQALAAKGLGHQFFELAGSTVRLVVSAGEYLEPWWHENA